MTSNMSDDEILKNAVDSIIKEYRESGTVLTPEQEARFNRFVTGLLDAEPPAPEQIWQAMEAAVEAVRCQNKERSLEGINMFMLEFISGVDRASGAFQYLPLLTQAKGAVKAGHFVRAGELLVEFLAKCREAAQAME